MHRFAIATGAVYLAAAAGCRSAPATQTRRTSSVIQREFGRTRDGADVKIYTITNANGMTAKVTEYGATLTELWVPDRAGTLTDVVLGYEQLDDYVAAPFYLGATLGRVANRIANGKFTLDGRTYTLATNRAPNHLHGGLRGFDKRIWMSRAGAASVEFPYVSPDAEAGYTGTLAVGVTYRLTDDNELRIDYTATTDTPTPIKLTNHSFLNLAGSGTILDHVLTINADRYTPANASLVPTGEIVSVVGTPLDFTTPHRIGERIDAMRAVANGYDHNLVLTRASDALSFAARVEEPRSGRVLEIWTTEPGVQFFTGNRFDGSFVGVGGVVYKQHAGFALEPQHFPDAINHPEFPSVVLRPGHVFHSSTVYRFSSRPAARD
jgi:aldose 1-epimerase